MLTHFRDLRPQNIPDFYHAIRRTAGQQSTIRMKRERRDRQTVSCKTLGCSRCDIPNHDLIPNGACQPRSIGRKNQITVIVPLRACG